jgi:tetratricopeptide (TPR) repeat protein
MTDICTIKHKVMHRHLYIFLIFLYAMPVIAQTPDTVKLEKVPVQLPFSSNSVSKSAKKLSRSLDEGKSDDKIAEEYEELAKNLVTNNEAAKAEEYLKRALDIYTRLGKRRKVAAVNRELARVQEQIKNMPEAIRYYEEASRTTTDPSERLLNLNDANRLRNQSNPVAQSKLIQSNIQLLEEKGNNEEKSTAYRQLAETNLQMNQSSEAIGNYEKALEVIPEKNTEALKIKGEMARVYVADRQFDKAIDLSREVVQKAQEIKDVKTEISGLQSLSHVYFSDARADQGMETLMQAYNLSLASGQTLEAKRSLELLADQYRKNGGNGKLLELYRNFLDNLERVIRADSSLVDVKLFQATENRIRQLENERALKDELLMRTNRFNYVLIASVILVILLAALIARAWYTIRIRNRKIALQSLRREMNPHFIFNSLNSVNQFIAQNNELEANKYLTSYSRLMRNVMENSGKDFVRLSNEIEQLREYLDLEQLRFHEKFTYEISVDEHIDVDATHIPNMLIQPHLENAIWHGLRYRENKGLLKLGFVQDGNTIYITVDDNGIGTAQSELMKTQNQRVHRSRGLTNITERIKLLNDLYHTGIRLTTTEKEAPETGVTVKTSIKMVQP